MREPTAELRALHDLARAASEGTTDVEELLAQVCRSVVERFGFERASVARYSPSDRTVSSVAAHGIPLELLPPSLPIEEQPILERALETGATVFVADAGKEPALSPEIVEAFGVRSLLAVPLISGGECLGFLGADRGGAVFRVDDETLDLLTTIGAVTAVFLQQAIEHSELRRIDEVKTNFIALASHELRSPATVVHGIAATLHLRGDELTDEQRHQLRRALYEQTGRLRALVEQLLDLSRLEADAIDISPERLPVRRRIEEVVLTHAGERTHDVRIDVPPDVEAIVDPNAFERIVANLVTNALRYGEPPVVVSARQSDHHFRLAVADHGRGVAPDFVPRLFERFARSEPSIAGAQGAGLGLSIARSYAEAHGGDILYRDAEPAGAHFELVLPVRLETVDTR